MTGDQRHLNDDRLADLALDCLDSTAREKTLEHLETCRSCDLRFREAVRELERLRAASPRNLRPSRTVTRRRLAVAAAVAAGLITVTAVWQIGFRRTPPGDFLVALDTEAVIVRIVGEDQADPAFVAALEAYEARDTKRVVELLQDKTIPPQFDPVRLAYASALVAERRFEDAVRELQALKILTLPQPARDRARWVLQKAHRGAGDPASADGLLQGLAGREGEFQARARDALEAEGR